MNNFYKLIFNDIHQLPMGLYQINFQSQWLFRLKDRYCIIIQMHHKLKYGHSLKRIISKLIKELNESDSSLKILVFIDQNDFNEFEIPNDIVNTTILSTEKEWLSDGRFALRDSQCIIYHYRGNQVSTRTCVLFEQDTFYTNKIIIIIDDNEIYGGSKSIPTAHVWYKEELFQDGLPLFSMLLL